MNELIKQWLKCKALEQEAQKERQAVEDRLTELLKFDVNQDHSKTFEEGDFKVKLTGRVNRTVDSDLAQDIATEHNLDNQLTNLFKWSADLKLSAWKEASVAVKTIFSKAVTSKPGRPSFVITKKEPKNG